MTNEPFVTATGLVKIYKVAELEVVALQGLDLEIARGEMLAIVGPSGCGKSTFLNILGGLDRPSAGALQAGERDLLKLNQAELTRYRRDEVGFIWQQTTRNLLPYLTARENIELLMTLAGRGASERKVWASELLQAVDMSEYAHQRPPQLSGGQQQRVAIACALANRPKILLGDEPTGEVDWGTAQRILRLLHTLRERYGLTVVLVTHDQRVAEQTDRVVQMHDGRFSAETVRTDGERSGTNDQRDQTNLPGPGEHGEVVSPVAPRPALSEELVVVDRTGRLQLPGDQRALAGIGRRARVELVDDGILIRPGDDDSRAAGEPGDGSVEPVYQSLYSTEPLPVSKPSKNGNSRWGFWKRRDR
jgi:peptide/nickel transport system ATP-binding protein